MVDKKEVMLNVFIKSDFPLKVKDVAAIIGVSEKTIRNYIHLYNRAQSEDLFKKSGTSYYLNEATKQQLIASQQVKREQFASSKERGDHLLHTLLTRKNEQISIFDLADELFISYSTMRNVITAVNEKLLPYNLKVVSKNNRLSLNGTQADKQRLFADMVHNEVNNSLYSIDQLAEYFEPNYVATIEASLKTYIEKQQLKVNQIAFFNILVHFLIILYGTTRTIKKMSPAIKDPLAKIIFEHLGFYPRGNDIEKLKDIITLNSQNNLSEKEVSEETKKLVDEIIYQLNEIYSIDLSKAICRNGLLIHIKNLISRKKEGTYARNPLKDTIIHKTPTVFEIATTAAIIICNYFQWDALPEDEIAFLALHIGIELNRKKRDNHKINVLLLTPMYEQVSSAVSSKLLTIFENDLQLMNRNDYLLSSDGQKPELIISYSPIEIPSIESVTISPFLTTEDINQLSKAINKIVYQKSIQTLRENFDKYFNKKFFYMYEKHDFPKDKYQLIDTLCSELASAEIIDEAFTAKIKEREQMASTAFKRIAIPHQFTYAPKKSIISVVISQNGIQWGDKKVNLILLTCITPEDQLEFGKLYELLLDVFANDFFLNKLFNVNDFDSFKKLIVV